MALRPGWQGCSAAMSLSQWRLRLPQAISIQEIDRSGQVAVLGVPNSGKSSLVNELVGTKARLSIITLAAVFIWAGMHQLLQAISICLAAAGLNCVAKAPNNATTHLGLGPQVAQSGQTPCSHAYLLTNPHDS